MDELNPFQPLPPIQSLTTSKRVHVNEEVPWHGKEVPWDVNEEVPWHGKEVPWGGDEGSWDNMNNTSKVVPGNQAFIHRSEVRNARPSSVDADVAVRRTLGSLDGSAAHALLSRIFSLTEPHLPAGDYSCSECPLGDMLTVDSLKCLEFYFEDCVEKNKRGDEGGVTMDEFVSLWMQHVYEKQDDTELRRLFMKIDTQCEGFISWKEFITFTWVEMNKLDIMKVLDYRAPYPERLRVRCPHREKDNIVTICVMQTHCLAKPACNIGQRREIPRGGRYVTLSRDGMMRVFDFSCSLLQCFTLRKYHAKSLYNVISTDMVYLSGMRMAAVCFADSHTIHLYSLIPQGSMGYRLVKEYEIRGLKAAPICFEYIEDTENREISHLLWGDSHGTISILRFSSVVTDGPFGRQMSNRVLKYHNLVKIEQGKYSNTATFSEIEKLHDDWVVKIKSCSDISPGGFISCSRGNNMSLYYGDISEPRRGTTISIYRGVNCFEYCNDSSCIYAGCVDGKIRIVRPSLARVTNVLSGHTKPVSAIVVDNRRSIVISAGEDHTILVYSLKLSTHMQSLDVSFGSIDGLYHVSAMYLNPSNSALLIGTRYLGMFEYKETIDHTGNAYLTSHDGTCNQALYNPLFDIVVSCDIKSTVSLWSLKTGQKIIQYQDCHQKMIKGNLVNQEIVTMNFDPSYRRLITGAHDGTAHMWNLNNGMLLRRFTPKHDVRQEKNKTVKISKASDDAIGLIWSEENTRIAVALGGSRKIYTYIDETDNKECYDFPAMHVSDINSMILLPPMCVASCSSSGDIIIRSIVSGRPYLMFNATVSKSSILEERLGEFRANVRGAASVSRRYSNVPDNILSISSTRHHKYSSVQRPAVDDKPGMDDADSSLYDKPRYEHMAFAAALGFDESTISELSFKNERYSDVDMSYSSIRSSFQQSFTMEANSRNSSSFQDWSLPVNNSVDCMLVLLNRVNTNHTATLITGGADGWVRAWSTTIKGGLLAQFNAAHHKEENIISMATDVENEYLFTGDSEGYVKVWDIETFCLDEKQLLMVTDREDYLQRKVTKYSQFTFLVDDMNKSGKRLSRRRRLRSQLAMHGIPGQESDPLRTLKSPSLMNSFRAHLRGVTSLTYVDRQSLIISSSADGNVRLWTINGQYIGHFGQSKKWDLSMLSEVNNSTRLLPHDVKKVASSTTLMVWNGGNFSRWKKLKALCLATGLTSYIFNLAKERASQKNSHSGVASVVTPTETSSLQVEEPENVQKLGKNTQQSFWSNIATAIQISISNYLNKINLSNIGEVHESDRDIDSIVSDLNPRPENKGLAAIIKMIWMESLRLQVSTMRENAHLLQTSRTQAQLSSFTTEDGTKLRIHASAGGVPEDMKIEIKPDGVQTEKRRGTGLLKAHIKKHELRFSVDQRFGSQSASPEGNAQLNQVYGTSQSQSNFYKALTELTQRMEANRSRARAESVMSSTSEFPKVLTSKYFGKSYKKCGRHKPFPKMDPVKLYDTKCVAFRSLPYMTIDPLVTPLLPQRVNKLMEARTHMKSCESKAKCRVKQKLANAGLLQS